MSRRQLSKKDIKEINEKIFQNCGLLDFFSKKERLDMVDDQLIIRDGQVLFFMLGDKPVPTLTLLLRDQLLPTVTVDMGAVKFVASGADIMRPGVVDVDESVQSGSVVCVVDERNKKPLAVGEALFGSSELLEQKNGKVVKSLHYIGDDIWQRSSSA